MDAALAHSLQDRKRRCDRGETRATRPVSIRKGTQTIIRFAIPKQRFLLAASAAQFHRRASNPGLGLAEKTRRCAGSARITAWGISQNSITLS